MSYTNTFGGTAIAPSNPAYLSLSISANTALVWPLEGGPESTPAVASQIDVTATVASLSLAMPPGNTGSNGVQAAISNVGSNSFTVTDTSGNAIVVIAANQSWIVTLTTNTTLNGTWRALQLGATTSNANAGTLAGDGLQAAGAALQVNAPTTLLSASTLLTASYRGSLVVWQGAAGTFSLDLIANLGAGWFAAFANEGTGTLTIAPTGGALINGAASLSIAPGNSGVVVCAAGGFWTYGALLGALSIAEGGTGATNAPGALTNLGGTATGQAIFTAPSASSVISLLGLSKTAFFEQTVSTNQSITATSSANVYVCSAALTLSLPLSTGLTPNFYIVAIAEGGAVTITPQVSDKINGGAAGASYVVAQGTSVLLFTDALGNFWPLLPPAISSAMVPVVTAATTLAALEALGFTAPVLTALLQTTVALVLSGLGGAALAGSGTQTFLVANATPATQEAVPITQGDARYAALAGLSTQAFAVAAATVATGAPQFGQVVGGSTTHQVTGSRALGTTYTNGQPTAITVIVSGLANTTSNYQALVNGVGVSVQTVPATYAGTITFVVPPGATYEVAFITGSGALDIWVEVY